MNQRLRFSFIVCFVMHCFIGFSQQSQTIHSNASIAEKIYLQLDKDIYTTGSTIWFKAIVAKAFDNAPTNLSGILYVELINAEKRLIEKKLIKIDTGIGEGYFDLPQTFEVGTYLIRAYTEWNKNFDSDFFFEKYIEVFSIYDSTTNKEGTSQNELSLTKEIPEINSTINNDLDLQFLPESGELVHGFSSKVGFKALNSLGNGIPIEGAVFDDKNNQITTFKSNALGMGSFLLDSINGNRTYHAKLNNEPTVYPLPKVTFMGNVLSVVEKDKIITIHTSSNYLKNDSISLTVSFRGTTLHELKAPLKNGTLKFLFSSSELPEGIIVFKMMDNYKSVVAERLYFNKRLENELNIKSATNKTVYSKRELTNLSVETTNKVNEPVTANASILVIDKKEWGDMQSLRDNILSYFLLSSELKGEIENPGYYFNNNENKEADLDALMITQGWRQYKYDKPYEKLSFKPETALTVSGTAISKALNNKDNQIDLTMMTFGKEEVFYTQTTDSFGKFSFDLDDEYGDELNILIQSSKKSGKNVNYDFRLDKKNTPPIIFDFKKSGNKPDPIIKELVEKESKKAIILNDLYIPEGNIALDEVLLTGRNLSAAQQKVTKRFGEPDRIIDGKDIQEKEQTWSYGLFSVLLFSFPDKIQIKRFGGGVLYAWGLNNEVTLVVIDGIPVRPYEYNLIQGIPPSQVTSVEVIEHATFFQSFYCELFPEGRCIEAPPTGNIIAIYTKAGIGIHGAFPNKSKGITNMTVPVFSESKSFYAPKYDKINAEDLEWPDLRTLIHWQPILQTDGSGIAKTSFYNTDITGDVLVIVEAITENGAVAYKELTYKVE